MNGDGKRHPEVENRTYDDREHALYTHCADWIWDEEESTQPGEPHSNPILGLFVLLPDESLCFLDHN